MAGRRVQPGCWPVTQQCCQQCQGLRAQPGDESAVIFVLHCGVSTQLPCTTCVAFEFRGHFHQHRQRFHVDVLYQLSLFELHVAFLCFVLH